MSKFVYVTSQTTQAGVYTPLRSRQAPYTAPQMSLLNGILEGYTENQRIGRQINLKRLQIKAVLTGATVCRLIVVYYKAVNGKPVTYETFLKKLAYDWYIDPIQPYLELDRSEFEVLYDNTTEEYLSRFLNVDIDLTGKKTIYSGATEFQDHIKSGGLYTIMLTNATGTSSNCSFLGTLHYNDQ